MVEGDSCNNKTVSAVIQGVADHGTAFTHKIVTQQPSRPTSSRLHSMRRQWRQRSDCRKKTRKVAHGHKFGSRRATITHPGRTRASLAPNNGLAAFSIVPSGCDNRGHSANLAGG